MKYNMMKRTLAGVLAVLCVAAYLPANVGTGGLFGGTVIVANADSGIVAEPAGTVVGGNEPIMNGAEQETTEAPTEQETLPYTIPSGLTATCGQTLADVQLPTANNGTWAWDDSAQVIQNSDNKGTQNFKATFTTSDNTTYTVDVPITISHSTYVNAKEYDVFPENDMHDWVNVEYCSGCKYIINADSDVNKIPVDDFTSLNEGDILATYNHEKTITEEIKDEDGNSTGETNTVNVLNLNFITVKDTDGERLTELEYDWIADKNYTIVSKTRETIVSTFTDDGNIISDEMTGVIDELNAHYCKSDDNPTGYDEVVVWENIFIVKATDATDKTSNVTLNTNEGTINEGDITQYTHGIGATLPTDVTRQNYTFLGWYDNESCNGEPVTEISVTDTDDKTYYAKWEALPISIKQGTYIRMGSYNGYDVDWYCEVVNKTGTMMMSKYVIKNSNFSNGSDWYPNSAIRAWLAGNFKYELGLTQNELNFAAAKKLQYMNVADKFMLPSFEELKNRACTQVCYLNATTTQQHVYWLRTPRRINGDRFNVRVVRSVDKKVSARYSGSSYGGRGVRPIFYLDINKLKTAIEKGSVTWSGTGKENDPYVFEKRNTVNIASSEGGNISQVSATKANTKIFEDTNLNDNNPDATARLVKDAEVTLTAVPKDGYELKSLTAGDTTATLNGNVATFTMPADDVTVTPTFEKINYTITTADVTNGTITVTNAATYGDTVTLTVAPANGYELDTLTVTGADGKTIPVENNSCFTMPTSNVTVSATFKEVEKTDISSAVIKLDNSSFNYDDAEKTVKYTVTLGEKTLTEDTDFTLEGDTTATAAGTYIIKIKGIGAYEGEAKTTWQIVPANVTVKVNGEVVENAEYNKSLTVTAPKSESGKKFSHWEVNNKPVSYSAIYSFIVKESVDLIPVYVEDSATVDAQAVLNMATSKTTYNGKNAIKFTFTHSIPAGYTVQEVGLLYGTNKLVGADTTKEGYATVNLVENKDYGVDDVKSVVRSQGSNVKRYVASYKKRNGIVTFSYGVGKNRDAYTYAMGYVKVTKDGKEDILYTDFTPATYNTVS